MSAKDNEKEREKIVPLYRTRYPNWHQFFFPRDCIISRIIQKGVTFVPFSPSLSVITIPNAFAPFLVITPARYSAQKRPPRSLMFLASLPCVSSCSLDSFRRTPRSYAYIIPTKALRKAHVYVSVYICRFSTARKYMPLPFLLYGINLKRVLALETWKHKRIPVSSKFLYPVKRIQRL